MPKSSAAKANTRKAPAKKAGSTASGAKKRGASSAGLKARVQELELMVDAMPVNVLVCDPNDDFKVIYSNETSKTTLSTLEHLLPIAAEDLLGQSIDIFHKHPEHQRRLLSDPKNLPHQAQITLGDETLDLLVSAVYDANGNYSKAMLTWSIITAKVKADAEANRLAQMVDNMPTNVLMADPNDDFKIVYANNTSMETLATLEHLLPVKAADLVGSSIDIFHKDPSHQRRILSDPGNLPHQAMISLGDETLDLQVSAINDKEGAYLGPMLTWTIVTEKIKADAEAKRLTQMVDNMPINVMMADPNDEFKIVYLNQTSQKTLANIEHLLPIRADEVLGSSIDIFHKNPEHQRRMLRDPKNLPHSAKIAVGDETLDLQVSAIHDERGDYIGPMVSWSVVTQQLKLAEDVKHMVEAVSGASSEMLSSSEAMAATAEETSRQSSVVAAASEEATTNVQTVASAAEELASSIAEIGRQVAESANIAEGAVEEARTTNETVKSLSEASQKIGEVVNLISDIAGQTNLLALNATIEAARAGEAGKGFAVVASEVKSLANQTGKATEDIASQINAIQAATAESVTAIEGIGGTIGQISEIATTIASAVEEQGAATQEISNNVQQAAQGTQEVSNTIQSVTQAAQESGEAAVQIKDASGELSQQSEGMRSTIENFIAEI